MSQAQSGFNPQELIRTASLPKQEWDEYFNRIYVEKEIKRKLVNYGLLLEQFDQVGFDQMTLAYHGAVLLYGPPGTGKTTLAKGVANEVAKRLNAEIDFRQVDIEHLFSGRLGDTPKAVSEVFDLIIESASSGTKQIVLLDEVESLISDRGLIGDTDPMDVGRAVNIALEKLDELASHSNIYIISTSNLPSAVDSAFFDRADVHFRVGNPDQTNRRDILIDIFSDLNETFGTEFSKDSDNLDRLVADTDGFSGRRLRKVVLESLVADEATIHDPSTLNFEKVHETVRETRERLISRQDNQTKATDLLESEGSQSDTEDTETSTPEPLSNTVPESTDSRTNGSSDEGETDESSTMTKRLTPDDEAEDEGDTAVETSGQSGVEEDTDISRDSPNETEDVLFSRTTVVDSLEMRPEEKMLERVANFFTEILDIAGNSNPDRVAQVLTSDVVGEALTSVCAQEDLKNIEMTVGGQTVCVDVGYAVGEAEPISAPFDDVAASLSPDGDITITFVVDGERIELDHRLGSLSVEKDELHIQLRRLTANNTEQPT